MIYLGLGSNLGDRILNIELARGYLNAFGVNILNFSRYYETPPWGKTDQPHYVNAVCSAYTTSSPEKLLSIIHEVERLLGRVRRDKWEARTLDIDILYYANEPRKTDTLTLPHPYLAERAFVLIPWNDIAPELYLENLDKTISELCSNLPISAFSGIKIIEPDFLPNALNFDTKLIMA